MKAVEKHITTTKRVVSGSYQTLVLFVLALYLHSLQTELKVFKKDKHAICCQPGSKLCLHCHVKRHEQDRQTFPPSKSKISLPDVWCCLQTLLFSATMPSALHEFAKAGLKEAEVVRLDTETRISQDLATAFFTIRYALQMQLRLSSGCRLKQHRLP